MKRVALLALMLVGCTTAGQHPIATTAIGTALVTGAAATCAIECGEPTAAGATVLVVLESMGVAAVVAMFAIPLIVEASK